MPGEFNKGKKSIVLY